MTLRAQSSPRVLDPEQTHIAHPGLHSTPSDVVRESGGQLLDATTRAFMEPRFGHDFSRVRIHAGEHAARSAASVGALAYTVGDHIAFNAGQFRPESSRGRELLAHELAHVVQQRAGRASATAVAPQGGAAELDADHAVGELAAGRSAVHLHTTHFEGIQRKVQFRDVGRGEQSGFARLPDLVARLNAMSTGLTYSLDGNDLAYTPIPGEQASGFDAQMAEFIDAKELLPLRLTNRHGLLGSHITGFNRQVLADEWAPGYADVDDLLASSDLGLQFVLVHFLRERSATRDYSRRIGSPTFTQTEFDRAHGQGIEAEARLLRDVFDDRTIRFVSDAASAVFRTFRNGRGDTFRARLRQQRNVDAVSIEIRLRDGRVLTPDEYLRLRRAEQTREQIESERLRGATEHMAGGRSVPAP